MESKKMMAIRLDAPCRIEEMIPAEVDRPTAKPGYAVVRVKAFGVNESEVTSRKGGSSADFSYPRILGIEGAGVIEEVSDESGFKPGQKIMTMMEGLGRSIDGSYAEYMLVKEENLIKFDSGLDWSILGALPEMLQTAYGSLTHALGLKKGDTLLIRGGTSTVGLMSAVLAKDAGATVISTSRRAEKLEILRQYGVDYPVLDDETIGESIQKIVPDGIDKVLELVGFSTLFEDMSFLKKGGKACFTGALGNQWTLDHFSPYMIPVGKFLTSYAGGVKDLPSDALSGILHSIEDNGMKVPIAKVYHGLEEVGQAHYNLESGKYMGKHVVVL